ncbi:phosphate ABC transporter permease PstA [Actinomarinicola tropica]|uniref:Phosphate transport system permease protein PstA n=1 Tax=Actinomarinicola tropica TaxID=2789776 RepID=A0A5Q2RHY7_9ACTN|nr:phosphate ABC transporter permease PstA [Actinomarinicola tropica]QGG93966.1 phosphate ABC transporter permease PstA [Actinomarinicola tropica]
MTVLSTPGAIAERTSKDSVERQLTGGRADVSGRAFQVVVGGALAVSLVVLLVLLVDVATDSWSVFTTRGWDFVTSKLSSQAADAGVIQGLVGTFWIGVFVVTVSFPLGVAAAVYLEEYAVKGRFTNLVDLTIRNLAGVPSVVYGILGLTIFVNALRPLTGPDANGRSIMSAGLTLAILVLPIIIITAAEAIRAVPQGIREAGYGVGATRWEVVRHHVLPYASPGVLTGTVLALGRALGEAAPLILVGATTGYLSRGDSFVDLAAIRERFAAMPTLIANWASQPGGQGWEANTSAAIVVLLVVVLIANGTAILLRNRFESKRR